MFQQIADLGQKLFLGRACGLFHFLELVALGCILDPVDHLHQQEDHPCDDQKVDQRGDEVAVVEGGRTGLFRSGERVVLTPVKRDEVVGEIDATQDQPDDRLDQIADKRCDDCGERGADDDTCLLYTSDAADD